MRFIDSHTEGEPTRVIIEGGPDLGNGSLQERLIRFKENHDDVRRTAINEPRGSEAVVGALLCEPADSTCATGVIFFNNTGYLGLCGHGAMGVAATLAYQSRVALGICRIETPVGVVEANLLTPNQVAIENVPSYRYRQKVSVNVPELGTIVGDIAWGGNWFFLVEESPVPLILENEKQLTTAARTIRSELERQQITGANDEEIDHIEFFGPAESPDAHSRNFVHCPGGAYDRSPCGTGTSAKLACLAADEKLKPGDFWIQESIIGSRFLATYRNSSENHIIPTITGNAYICAEGTLIQQPEDPFRNGISVKGAK